MIGELIIYGTPPCTYRPLVQLLELARESRREYETTNRVTWMTY